MDIKLFIHNVGSILAALTSLGLAVFTYRNNRRAVANITLALALLCVTIFYISHVIGVNIVNPELSRSVLMWNMIVIYIVAFNAHSVFAVLGTLREKRLMLGLIYAAGIFLTIFYLTNPDTFLLPSSPKLYLPNYYEAGTYHWMMRLLFNFAVPIYFLSEMARSYRRADPAMRNRLKYFFVSLTLGYLIGFIPVLLIFDIPVDPNWGLFFIFFYAIPFVYAVVHYELLDIRLLAKRAFLYSLAVVSVSFTIIAISYSHSVISTRYPSFPAWLVPLFAALIAVAISLFIWRKIRETDLLKYEFVNVVTHKFRTPLTHIRWSTEQLRSLPLPEKAAGIISQLDREGVRLTELTNLLVELGDTDASIHRYEFNRLELCDLLREGLSPLQSEFRNKRIGVHFNCTGGVYVRGDRERLAFAFQIILDNAVTYTPAGGSVSVSVHPADGTASVTVTDTGIGIPADKLPYIFEKFFRSDAAKKMHTEGMGIGLSIAKTVVNRHGGAIKATSPGLGKGTSFTVMLPRAT